MVMAYFEVLTWHSPGEIEENNKKPSVRISIILTEIQTGYFLNTSLEITTTLP
jgi:hypothetical protein